jgi:putative ABC transport system permease protein
LDFQPSGIRTATSRGHTVWDFSILALALAAVGLYSVVSYSVATRTNEFGIRMALGAKATDVFRMVLSSTAVNLGGGLAIGILLSIAFDKLAPKWVTVILAGVTLLLIVAAALACFVPARRFRRSHGKLRSE